MTIGRILSSVPTTENVVFSLINVHHAFALVLLGADQETAVELAKLIGYDDDPVECLNQLRSKLDDFAKLDSIKQSSGVFDFPRSEDKLFIGLNFEESEGQFNH